MKPSHVKLIISIIKKLRDTFPRKSLLTTYKAFLRPHIDYGDVIYDQLSNEPFCEKLESVYYKAPLAITGAIQGTLREKNFIELGLESLKSRWFRRLCCMFKIMKNHAPEYLNNLNPKRKQILTHKRSIFQVTTVEQSILNLLFSLPHFRNGSTLIRV